MRVRNYQEAVDALYPKLEEYLVEHEIYPNKGLFSCLSPDHEDSNPSCGLVSSKEAWHCFGCQTSGTIFNAAAALEGFPAQGRGFIEETLPYLANKYGVELKVEPLTEEELYEIETFRAYRVASEFIVGGKPTERYLQAITTQ